MRLVEKRVNSHVGTVMVANAPIQYSTPGMTLRIERITRPNRPKVDNEDGSRDAAIVEATDTFVTIAPSATRAASCKAMVIHVQW